MDIMLALRQQPHERTEQVAHYALPVFDLFRFLFYSAKPTLYIS